MLDGGCPCGAATQQMAVWPEAVVVLVLVLVMAARALLAAGALGAGRGALLLAWPACMGGAWWCWPPVDARWHPRLPGTASRIDVGLSPGPAGCG